MSQLNNESIEDIANRVLEHAFALRENAVAAFREWEHNPTFSNAILRDDAREDAEPSTDMISLARAVLAQIATDRARSTKKR